MIRVAGSAFVMAMCLAVVACAAEDDPAAPTPEAVISAQETNDAGATTQSPPASPTAVLPVEDDAWLISGAGVGPVDIGMTLDQAVVALGQARVEGPCKSLFFTEDLDSLIVSAAWDDPNEIVTSLTIARATFDVDGVSWPLATDEGIRVGSSADEVILAYPGATVSDFENLNAGPQQLVSLTDNGVPLVMVIDKGTNVVVEILVNLTEPPLEYCG